MCSLRLYSIPFSRIRVVISLSILLCAYPPLGFTQAANPSADFADAVVPRLPAQSPVTPIAALPPEEQGDLQMARGNYAAALSAYKEGALTSAVLWNKVGVAYHHLFALSEARKAYETALAIDPRYPPALNNLAAVYHAQHNYKQAERLYKRALKYQPNSAVTYSNLGTSYFAGGNYKKGTKAYQIAFRLDPNVFSPDSSKKVEEASSRQQLIAINYYLAKTYANAGKKDQALTYLRKAFGEGFRDRKRLMADRGFDPIRGTPEFHQLLVEEHLD